MTTSTGDSAEQLRNTMVDAIVATRPTSPAVEAAMRAVPRHQFVPRAPIEDAYADEAVITKRSSDGTALSCASVPSLVAVMLDQLEVQPGQRILEIGAGTGYNAALLAHLTGPDGQVTTVDIDADLTTQARRNLDATGHRHVQVATRDGALGDITHAPYDRIIVTVGAWDLPAAWWQQLTPGGRLVVPLRWRGQTRCIAFNYHNRELRADFVELCGFVPMIGQDGEHTTALTPDNSVTLYWDADQTIDPAALTHVLDQPESQQWSGITVGPEESFDGIWLRLTATEPGTCRITATTPAVESGLCTPAITGRSPALADNDSLAYLTLRRTDQSTWELGATGHGTTGRQLAERICQTAEAWNNNRSIQPLITAQPVDHADKLRQPRLIHKPECLLAVTY